MPTRARGAPKHAEKAVSASLPGRDGMVVDYRQNAARLRSQNRVADRFADRVHRNRPVRDVDDPEVSSATGTMRKGSYMIDVTIVPDSGTDELVGIAGAMTIQIDGKDHSYRLEYTRGP